MEGQAQSGGKIAAKLKVGAGFCATQPMMKMRGMEYEPKFPAPFNKCAEQRNRISPAREPDGQAHPRLQQRCVERKWVQCAHDWMIRRGSVIEEAATVKRAGRDVRCRFPILKLCCRRGEPQPTTRP